MVAGIDRALRVEESHAQLKYCMEVLEPSFPPATSADMPQVPDFQELASETATASASMYQVRGAVGVAGWRFFRGGGSVFLAGAAQVGGKGGDTVSRRVRDAGGQARRWVRPADPDAGRCTDGPNRTEPKELAFFGPAFPQVQSRDPVLRSVVRRLREQCRFEVVQRRRTVFLQQDLFQFIFCAGEPPIQFQRPLKLPPGPCGGATVARSPERLH